ncbi:MAG: hypothetical protein HYY49_06970 [Ignavibacteriales bacterium]|nr:hypothetical protein [Ignavibacteriales bacterium]
MAKISTNSPREIIEDFAQAIANRKKQPKKPDQGVINFRKEVQDGIPRPVWEVPLEFLRFRKDNGRITSDVLSYERVHGVLKEDSDDAQKKIAEFLEKKDPEKTEDLLSSIKHEGQRDPAIITSDGFLINGNRRKLVMEKLNSDRKNGDDFRFMRVIILPGKTDEGGAPTIKEIEEIENRYQLQKDGKAEYYKFDRALSIRLKVQKGMPLEEQLTDDPTYAGLPEKEFQKKIKEYENEYLKPLECIDRYLEYLDRSGLYDTISTSYSDRDGRWQAFYDYSKFREQLNDAKKLQALGLKEKEVGIVEDVAFKIIRKRELATSESGTRTGLGKVHSVMRELPKLIREEEGKPSLSKKELFKLKVVETSLPENERVDKNGNERSPKELDYAWGKKYASQIIGQLKKAYQLYEHGKDIEGPINLLRFALEKLNHEDLEDPSSIGAAFFDEAERLARDIQSRANALEKEFYKFKKNLRSLGNRDDK